jgi:hypothetical protein
LNPNSNSNSNYDAFLSFEGVILARLKATDNSKARQRRSEKPRLCYGKIQRLLYGAAPKPQRLPSDLPVQLDGGKITRKKASEAMLLTVKDGGPIKLTRNYRLFLQVNLSLIGQLSISGDRSRVSQVIGQDLSLIGHNWLSSGTSERT